MVELVADDGMVMGGGVMPGNAITGFTSLPVSFAITVSPYW
jgi:hypothetical protein